MLKNFGRVTWDIETDGMTVESIRETHTPDDPTLMDEKLLKRLQKLIEKPALDPTSGFVCAIGYQVTTPTGEQPVRFLLGDERDILSEFWSLWNYWCDQNYELVTFNGHSFDCPFVTRRSHALKLTPPVLRIWTKANRRWYRDYCLDLLEIWMAGSLGSLGQRYISLNTLSKFLGEGSKVGRGDAFAALLRTDKAAALDYLEQDVRLTSRLAKRIIGPVTQEPAPKDFHTSSETTIYRTGFRPTSAKAGSTSR